MYNSKDDVFSERGRFRKEKRDGKKRTKNEEREIRKRYARNQRERHRQMRVE